MSRNRLWPGQAMEWATELCKFRGYELLVAEYTQWGFDEVERGRNPDVVLKEVLAKIEENKGRLQTNANAGNLETNPRT